MTSFTPQCSPRLERRQVTRVHCADPGWRGRDWDVASVVSEIEQLSLYSREQSRDRRRAGTSARRRHRSGRQEDPRPEVTKSEPPSPGHSCASERSELLQVSLIVAQFNNMIHHMSSSTSTSYVTLVQETRGGPWQEEVTAGCCSLQAAPDPDHAALLGPAKEPVLASCVRSFMSWMAEKAERGTSALLESLPSLSKEDFHIVMIGLDGAGKTTALYRLKFDHYMNTVPTVGFNCERVKGTVGRSRGLTFLIWDVGGQER